MSIEELLSTAKTIAVVGMSHSPWRASTSVSRYMQSEGYRIIPVNPRISEALGEKVYPDLESIPMPVDVVCVFRRPEHVPEVVDSAIRIGAKAVWMQEGIVDEEAAAKARKAGLFVVMDRCMMVEHQMTLKR